MAWPDTRVIIDSCYSGRFVDPLSLEPNIASVTTSSSATEQSSRPCGSPRGTPPSSPSATSCSQRAGGKAAVEYDATELEPTYDLAAIEGLTTPSPDPNPNATCPAPNRVDPEPIGGWFTGE